MNSLEAKAEVKTTAKYIQFAAWVRADNKRGNAETSQGKMEVNAKMLTSALHKSATTLQHCDFILLSKHIAIM